MRIALLDLCGPGPSARHDQAVWAALASDLVGRGHDAQIVRLDDEGAATVDSPDRARRAMELDLTSFDVVVSGRHPSWLVRHPAHVVYVLGGQPPDGLGDDCIGALDHEALSRPDIRLVAAASESLARWAQTTSGGRSVLVARPQFTTNVAVEFAPPAAPRFFTSFRNGGQEEANVVLDAFRLNTDPRAILRVETDGTLPPTTDDRVQPVGPLSRDALIDEYRSTTAVVLTGRTALESDRAYLAMAAGAPLISTTDAGGAGELIEHGVNGMAVEASPERLDWAMRHVASSARTRWEMSLNSRRASAGIDWSPLLDSIEASADTVDRPRVLCLSTYGIDPMIGGGQRRVRHLLRSLARWADVTLMVSSAQVSGTRRRVLEPGIEQIEVGRSAAQIEAEEDLYFTLDRTPVDDVLAGRLANASPAVTREIRRQVASANAIIAAQPFLFPLLGNVDVPFVHDSQNVEAELKAKLFAGHGELGEWLTAEVESVETDATRAADLVVACTNSDLTALIAHADSPRASGIVIDNGVDTAALPQRQETDRLAARDEVLAVVDHSDSESRPLAIFIGSWHPPNVEAARLVLDVARQRPDWVFVLAGSHTSEFAGEDLPDNVSLVPIFAESFLWPLMAGADVALNPMASGGGSNLKVYDYLSVGVPVLTTPVGARGLEDSAQIATVTPPTVDAIAAALDVARSTGLTSPARLAAGRDVVRRHHDWSQLGERWAHAILDLIGTERPPERIVTRRRFDPMLASEPPPPADPVEALMERTGAAARTGIPTPIDTTMDPVLREHFKIADQHRFVGQRLPADARLRPAKELVIRVGKALSNEQVHYNEAMLDAARAMAEQLNEQERQIAELRAEVARLRSERVEEG